MTQSCIVDDIEIQILVEYHQTNDEMLERETMYRKMTEVMKPTMYQVDRKSQYLAKYRNERTGNANPKDEKDDVL